MIKQQQTELIDILKTRFEQNMYRHQALDWVKLEQKLLASPQKINILQAMQDTGGEPDVVDYDIETDEYIFMDCSEESPKGRRSICYDREAFDTRKEHKPAHNAVDMAKELGIELLTEAQYRALQQLGQFDNKTSSWIKTPDSIRQLGGALFCDRRYGQVFTYHNGASSYYAVRGFRGVLKV